MAGEIAAQASTYRRVCKAHGKPASFYAPHGRTVARSDPLHFCNDLPRLPVSPFTRLRQTRRSDGGVGVLTGVVKKSSVRQLALLPPPFDQDAHGNLVAFLGPCLLQFVPTRWMDRSYLPVCPTMELLAGPDLIAPRRSREHPRPRHPRAG
jgi:hypothetical protein